MSKFLVIVESPAKAKTIKKYLGKQFQVEASLGHVRDLPKSKLGVDIEHDFAPHYITIRSRSKVLKELKKTAAKKDVKAVYLAPDPDREGEAIAWHLKHELDNGRNPIYRVMFNEITQKAVQQAIEHPGEINQNMVDAQQARRLLDRIVGYSLSPLLWSKVRKGLSAGRVQSVAVRLVVDREREIQAFVPKEYWKIEADLLTAQQQKFRATVTFFQGQKVELANAAATEEILTVLRRAAYVVSRIEKKEQRRFPAPPFITSKLQQEAATKLHFTGKKTMMVAQQLYEGVEVGTEGPVGLITYMRTDSVRVSEEAQNQAREWIEREYGKEYAPPTPPKYKSKKNVQDAHEAIRPTYLTQDKTPDAIKKHLTPDQFKLYRLIWQRFLASQMAPAVFDAVAVDITAEVCTLRANGSTLKFKGFTSVYTESREEGKEHENGGDEEARILPPLEEGQPVILEALHPEQKFTQPPPRYNDATLVKALEEENIGRPSTYAPIISTILGRLYIERRENRFYPTELGSMINDLLVQHFPKILDVEFTAQMENQLDAVEEGKENWVALLREFYTPFSTELEKAKTEMQDIKAQVEVELDQVCEKCGGKMTVKWGRHGKFIACSNYPACRNTKRMKIEADGSIGIAPEDKVEEACERCGKPMVIKYGRFGKFLACSGYPECKTTKPINKEIGVPCPTSGCTGQVIERRSKRGRMFYGCSRYPQCTFSSWDLPLPQPCPQCGHPFLVKKFSKKTGEQIVCPKEECGYVRPPESAEGQAREGNPS
jgi:DNA topoisomerase I